MNGPVLAPGDAGYAPEIAAFNAAIVHTPDLVVGAESAADVVEAVRLARRRGLRVAVQATGHTETAVTSGLLISTKRLDGVSVDPRTRTATIGAGAKWGAVIAAAAPHGLAPVAGSSAVVGVVGYLLGGGLGPLARSHGFGSDHLLGLTVVTGEGDLVEASADRDPDLFWALRGGKAGLGIVTEVRLRLVELAALYAGSLFFEERDIEAALRGWVDWTAGADPLVTTSVAIIRFPPLDVVPEPLRGRRLLSLRFAFPGASDEGARLAAPLRSLAPVYLDDLGELLASDVARIHSDPDQPAPAWVTGMMLTHVEQRFASELLDQVGAGTDAPFVSAEVRHIGGPATGRDVEGGSAVGGRGAAFTLALVGADPELFETALPAAAGRLADALRPWLAAETNVNFAGRPLPGHRAPSWSPATAARLAEVRKRYDPDGVLAA